MIGSSIDGWKRLLAFELSRRHSRTNTTDRR
jgi:hypothetical protein